MISFLSKYLPNVVQLGWGGDAGWGTSIFQTLFMTFWSAKLKLWAKAPGKETSQGSFKQMIDKDTGKPLYRKFEEDPNGNISVIFTIDNIKI